MIDRDAIRLRWEADKRTARSETNGDGGCGPRVEVRAVGWGGLAAVSSITGLARSTIERGLKDLDVAPLTKGRVRREGGGPPQTTERDAVLHDDLRRLIEPDTLGDPMRSSLWLSKSLKKPVSTFADLDHPVSPNTVRARARHRVLAAIQPKGRCANHPT
jgi:hypothetical protein